MWIVDRGVVVVARRCGDDMMGELATGERGLLVCGKITKACRNIAPWALVEIWLSCGCEHNSLTTQRHFLVFWGTGFPDVSVKRAKNAVYFFCKTVDRVS